MKKDIFKFTATATPTIPNYQTTYAATHGENPLLALRIPDEEGNIIDRREQAKFVMVKGRIDSIVYDLGEEQTGFIILS